LEACRQKIAPHMPPQQSPVQQAAVSVCGHLGKRVRDKEGHVLTRTCKGLG
jgi:hypothetical protein